MLFDQIFRDEIFKNALLAGCVWMCLSVGTLLLTAIGPHFASFHPARVHETGLAWYVTSGAFCGSLCVGKRIVRLLFNAVQVWLIAFAVATLLRLALGDCVKNGLDDLLGTLLGDFLLSVAFFVTMCQPAWKSAKLRA